MSDSGKLHFFLGVKAEFINGGIFLSQKAYATYIIQRAGMRDCKPISTPVDLNAKLKADEGERIPDPTQYRKLAGALQYLTFTRPHTAYAVHQICLYMHDPRLPHFQALKHWAGCPDTRRSTSGYCVFLGSNLVSWSSKRPPTVSRASAESEYKGIANAVAELTWIQNLLF
ncbi:uncharacterized mitochondrial protein AtMg00810-like [Brassica napus]|uniref:uncharacterized mitochondrial protein AtMg00810-like n=1 Tax=Brassica napus TaxID=3708 RepID=UPI0006AA85ED|nr:uncharacterized mitochondrial protein AtMg00810-like [Brassica napus]